MAAKKKAKPVVRRPRTKRVRSMSRAPQRRRASRQRKGTTRRTFTVLVEYKIPNGLDMYEYVAVLDERIRTAVGCPAVGTWASFAERKRSLSFEFEKRKQAFDVAGRLMDYWKRSVTWLWLCIRLFEEER